MSDFYADKPQKKLEDFIEKLTKEAEEKKKKEEEEKKREKEEAKKKSEEKLESKPLYGINPKDYIKDGKFDPKAYNTAMKDATKEAREKVDKLYDKDSEPTNEMAKVKDPYSELKEKEKKTQTKLKKEKDSLLNAGITEPANDMIAGKTRKAKNNIKNTNPEDKEDIEELAEEGARNLLSGDEKNYLDQDTLVAALDEIEKGQNYETVISGLNDHLKKGYDELREELKEERNRAQVKNLMIAGVNALAALVAAKAGVQYQASKVHSQIVKDELGRIEKDIDLKRRELSERVAATKSLVGDVFEDKRSILRRKREHENRKELTDLRFKQQQLRDSQRAERNLQLRSTQYFNKQAERAENRANKLEDEKRKNETNMIMYGLRQQGVAGKAALEQARRIATMGVRHDFNAKMLDLKEEMREKGKQFDLELWKEKQGIRKDTKEYFLAAAEERRLRAEERRFKSRLEMYGIKENSREAAEARRQKNSMERLLKNHELLLERRALATSLEDKNKYNRDITAIEKKLAKEEERRLEKINKLRANVEGAESEQEAKLIKVKEEAKLWAKKMADMESDSKRRKAIRKAGFGASSEKFLDENFIMGDKFDEAKAAQAYFNRHKGSRAAMAPSTLRRLTRDQQLLKGLQIEQEMFESLLQGAPSEGDRGMSGEIPVIYKGGQWIPLKQQ